MIREEKDNLFKEYLKKSKVLIVDPSSTARISVARMLIEMGSSTLLISYASDFKEADSEISLKSPALVICEYHLGKEYGLDLLQKKREEKQNTKDSIFVLLSGNSSQAAVARAAEEDVDCFILKPFTVNRFKSTLVEAAIAKIFPSEYVRKIEEGKDLLFSGEVDKSIACFNQAVTLNPEPTLACFYLGQAQLFKESFNQARSSFEKGLIINKIHYKCLTGLYDLLFKQAKYQDAYLVVKRLAKYFPANPKRLTSVLRLAILTNNFEDINSYYETFTHLDDRNDELLKYICSALITCGKHFISDGNKERALELFSKAAVSSAGRSKYIRFIVEIFIEFEFYRDAAIFLAKYPGDSQATADYSVMKLIISNGLDPIPKVIKSCKDLIQSGVKDIAVYKIIITRTLESGLQSAAETYFDEAKKIYPEKLVELQKCLIQ